MLGASPITGVSSIFQSPVWKTLPNGVSISTPLPSGIECDSATKLTRNGPSSMRPAALDDVELDLPGQPFFLELAGDQPGGERRREQRRLQLLGEIGQRADMILVAVGQDDPGEPLLLLLDELEVGQDQVDARIGRIGEGQAEVDHDPLAAAAVEIDVHADLARAAEGDEQQFFSGIIVASRCAAMSYNRLNPWMVRSGSIASKTFVCLSNRVARPPVAMTVSGRRLALDPLVSPSIIAT